jgi:uncharacterized repeat protein (TIGR02543 family)
MLLVNVLKKYNALKMNKIYKSIIYLFLIGVFSFVGYFSFAPSVDASITVCGECYPGGPHALVLNPGSYCVYTGVWSDACWTDAFTLSQYYKTYTRTCGTCPSEPAPIYYLLTVGKSGSGTVTTTDSLINCGSTCSRSYQEGTFVTLTASPSSGSYFVGWSGACSGTTPSCGISMTQNRNVTATFATISRTFTVIKDSVGGGIGSVVSNPSGISCGYTCASQTANFSNGTSVTLTATAASGSRFRYWSGACSGSGNCTATMLENRTATAHFIKTHWLAVSNSLQSGASGSTRTTDSRINCGSTCSALYDHNSSVTIQALPGANSVFTGWTGDCTGTASSCTVSITQSRNVTANFALQQRSLNVTKTGTGTGTVTSSPSGINCGSTCSAQYENGTTVVLTATPNTTTSTFTGWTGDCTGTASSCTVSITQSRNVTANFALQQRSLNVTKTGTGTGTVTSSPSGINCGSTCSAQYSHGTNVTLNAIIGANSIFSGWSGACSGTSLSCTFIMDASWFAVATFNLITHGITIEKKGSGDGLITSDPLGIRCGDPGSEDCRKDFVFDSSVTLTVYPFAGSYFAGWSGGSCSGITGRTCTFTVTQEAVIEAHFIRRIRPIYEEF